MSTTADELKDLIVTAVLAQKDLETAIEELRGDTGRSQNATNTRVATLEAGGGGGATTLDALTDTTLSAPANNHILTHNGSAWVNNATIEPRITALESGTPVVQLTEASSTNINAAATNNLIPWDTTPTSPLDIKDTAVFTHSTSTNPSRITVIPTGMFQVWAQAAFTCAGARYNGLLKLRIDGSTVVDGRAKMGYIRAASGHNEASLFCTWILNLTASQYIEILVDREAIATAATLNANQSLFQMIKL